MERLKFEDLVDTPIGTTIECKSVSVYSGGYYVYYTKGNIKLTMACNSSIQNVLFMECNNTHSTIYLVEGSDTFIEII